MGIIRDNIRRMKVEEPQTYKAIMKSYSSEDEFVRDALGLSTKAFNAYNLSKKKRSSTP